jgi:hypothetical protein
MTYNFSSVSPLKHVTTDHSLEIRIFLHYILDTDNIKFDMNYKIGLCTCQLISLIKITQIFETLFISFKTYFRSNSKYLGESDQSLLTLTLKTKDGRPQMSEQCYWKYLIRRKRGEHSVHSVYLHIYNLG